jgi:hypothetical protein
VTVDERVPDTSHTVLRRLSREGRENTDEWLPKIERKLVEDFKIDLSRRKLVRKKRCAGLTRT